MKIGTTKYGYVLSFHDSFHFLIIGSVVCQTTEVESLLVVMHCIMMYIQYAVLQYNSSLSTSSEILCTIG